MKHLLTNLCMILLMILSIPYNTIHATSTDKTNSTSWPKEFDGSLLSAQTAILIEANSGLILFEKNANEKMYPASITKIMTTLITLEHAKLGEVVTFSESAAYGIEPGSSSIYTDVGEQLTMEQCIYAMMLESANEVCLGVAEHISGDKDNFSNLMNQKAKEIGCKNTNFTNPHGLHDDNHYTTAYDMALISREALNYEEFVKVTNSKQYKMPKTNKKDARVWNNHHQMLHGWRTSQYEYDYCIGGKTGYTQKAGNTLVTYATKDNLTLIAVVMNANSSKSYPDHNLYTDTIQLFNYGFKNYKTVTVINEEENFYWNIPFFRKYTSLFDQNSAPIVLEDNRTVVLPKKASPSDLEINLTYIKDSNPTRTNTTIGSIQYMYDGKDVGNIDILFQPTATRSLLTIPSSNTISESKESPIIKEKDDHSFFIIIGIIIGILIIIFVIVHIIIRRNRNAAFSYYRGRKKKHTRH